MTNDLRDLYQAIGGLTAEVQSLRRDIGEMNRRVDARLDPIPAQLAEIVRRQDTLETGLKEFHEDLAETNKKIAEEVMPVVTEVKEWKQRGIGALAMAGMGGGAIGVALSNFWHYIWQALQSMGKP